jgi:acylphosphatase
MLEASDHTAMRTRAHIVATGLVQGVGFRWFVARRARELGLSGYVRNLSSGGVEAEAEGEREEVDLLVADIRRGPRAAHVVDVRLEWLPPAAPGPPAPGEQFQIR